MCASKKETLSKARTLISSGLHKKAIDLLLGYLEVSPNAPDVLNLLGRTYLLDHQPVRAATYLKIALKVKQRNSTNKKNTLGFQADSFSDDDMSYVESQSVEFSEDNFRLETDEPIIPIRPKDIQKPSSVRPLLSIGNIKTEKRQPEKADNGIQVTYRGRRRSTLPNYIPSPLKKNNENGVGDEIPKSLTSHASDELIHSNQTTANNNLASEQQKHFRHETFDSTSLIEASIIEEAVTKGPNTFDHEVEALGDESFEFIESDPLLTDEWLEIDEKKDNDLSEDISSPNLDKEHEEFNWDEFEVFDDFDEFACQEIVEEVQIGGKISREHRARQIAVEVLDSTDWNPLYLELLQQIFEENGWSATRAAIERQIDKGLSPDQLNLAWEIKQLWARISWVGSLQIINCFSSIPSIEEVQMFMEDEFDHWFNSDRLHRAFKSFYYYLKYRTGSLPQTLSGDCIFSFQEPRDFDLGIDSDSWYISNTTEKQTLLGLGHQFAQWPRPPENKMKIIKRLIK